MGKIPFFVVVFIEQTTIEIKGCPKSGLAAYDFRINAGIEPDSDNLILLSEDHVCVCEAACRKYKHLIDDVELCLAIKSDMVREEVSASEAALICKALTLFKSGGLSANLPGPKSSMLCRALEVMLIPKPYDPATASQS